MVAIVDKTLMALTEAGTLKMEELSNLQYNPRIPWVLTTQTSTWEHSTKEETENNGALAQENTLLILVIAEKTR